ncbi:MAG TPA: peptidase M64, partial [Bacteroidales bacterium]|nr:peptidase M64 [Bacteroidales bacterium]
MQRSFYESVTFPYPLQPVRVEIASRNENNEFIVKFTYDVDPKNYFISKEKLIGYESWKVLDNGATDNKLDIVFLAEGYTAAEIPKFRTDAMRFADYLKKCSPFKENINKFNVWAVASISA